MPTVMPYKEALALAKQQFQKTSTTTTTSASTLRIYFSGQMTVKYSIHGLTSTIATSTSTDKSTLSPIKENEPLSIFSKSLFIASQVLFVLNHANS